MRVRDCTGELLVKGSAHVHVFCKKFQDSTFVFTAWISDSWMICCKLNKVRWMTNRAVSDTAGSLRCESTKTQLIFLLLNPSTSTLQLQSVFISVLWYPCHVPGFLMGWCHFTRLIGPSHFHMPLVGLWYFYFHKPEDHSWLTWIQMKHTEACEKLFSSY